MYEVRKQRSNGLITNAVMSRSMHVPREGIHDGFLYPISWHALNPCECMTPYRDGYSACLPHALRIYSAGTFASPTRSNYFVVMKQMIAASFSLPYQKNNDDDDVGSFHHRLVVWSVQRLSHIAQHRCSRRWWIDRHIVWRVTFRAHSWNDSADDANWAPRLMNKLWFVWLVFLLLLFFSFSLFDIFCWLAGLLIWLVSIRQPVLTMKDMGWFAKPSSRSKATRLWVSTWHKKYTNNSSQANGYLWPVPQPSRSLMLLNWPQHHGWSLVSTYGLSITVQ